MDIYNSADDAVLMAVFRPVMMGSTVLDDYYEATAHPNVALMAVQISMQMLIIIRNCWINNTLADFSVADFVDFIPDPRQCSCGKRWYYVPP